MSNFGKAEATWKPKYRGFTTKSVYLTMHDGVKLAVDIQLPKGLASDAKIPSLILQTRYWRANDVRPPFKWFQKQSEAIEVFTCGGYALVFVDVRGTGASCGVWPYPWSSDEVKDEGEIVDWIIKQP
jgi:putative CocE/NonD family hydrolase